MPHARHQLTRARTCRCGQGVPRRGRSSSPARASSRSNPDHEGLRIDPCIPPSWPGFRVRRRFRGADYDIEVLNPEGVSSGIRSLSVDGRQINADVVPVATVGTTVQVQVVLGT